MFENTIIDVKAWLAPLDFTRIGTSMVFVALSVVLKRPVALGVIYILRFLAGRFEVDLSDAFQVAIRPALELFVFGLAVLIGLELLDVQGAFTDVANRLAASVLVLAIFYGTFKSGDLFAEVLRSKSASSMSQHTDWIVTVLRVVVVVIGLAAILNVWGIDIGPMLTGMGVAGAAVALAAQDLVKNLIAGASNIGERRFRVGDWIHAEGVVDGVVESISLRSTKVRQFDLALVHIPNGDLANAPLVNFSRVTHRRIYWIIPLAHSTHECPTRYDHRRDKELCRRQ